MQNNDNQTAQNDAINRGETNRKDLENEIRSTWLERKNLFQTFDKKTEVEIREEIKEVRSLLNEKPSEEESC